MAATLSAKDVAQALDTDARTARKFLRSELGTIGKGKRWAIEAKQMRSLKSKFAKWNDARPVATANDDDEVAEVEVNDD